MLAFVVSLLGYLYVATIGQLNADSDILAEQEYAALERAYGEGGIRRLNQEVVERAARQGPLLYVLAASDGAVITGDFQQLPATPVGDSIQRLDFDFERTDESGAPQSEGGVEGPIYSSEIVQPGEGEKIKEGDEIMARIIRIDTEERKIGLSMKNVRRQEP